jgi:hypothetical protein
MKKLSMYIRTNGPLIFSLGIAIAFFIFLLPFFTGLNPYQISSDYCSGADRDTSMCKWDVWTDSLSLLPALLVSTLVAWLISIGILRFFSIHWLVPLLGLVPFYGITMLFFTLKSTSTNIFFDLALESQILFILLIICLVILLAAFFGLSLINYYYHTRGLPRLTLYLSANLHLFLPIAFMFFFVSLLPILMRWASFFVLATSSSCDYSKGGGSINLCGNDVLTTNCGLVFFGLAGVSFLTWHWCKSLLSQRDILWRSPLWGVIWFYVLPLCSFCGGVLAGKITAFFHPFFDTCTSLDCTNYTISAILFSSGVFIIGLGLLFLLSFITYRQYSRQFS